MRLIILALALVFGLGNSSEQIEALVNQNKYAEAFELASKDAAAGDSAAHDWLGYFYEYGQGAPLDVGLAAKHYRIAAASGRNHARWRLGVMIDTGSIAGSLEEAVALFKATAEENYTNGIVSLAVMQISGRGTPQDAKAAFANYMKAARLGDAGGIRGIGVMHYLGETVPANPAEAAAWFLVSAELGSEQGEESFEMAIAENPALDEDSVLDRAEQIASELGLQP